MLGKMIKKAAISIIKPYLRFIKENREIRKARRDTANIDYNNLWKRYCFSMITSQQKISELFWTQVFQDKIWQKISRIYPKKKPQLDLVKNTLHRLKIRFADNKAQQICNAWDRDFKSIAEATNIILSHNANQSYSLYIRLYELELIDIILRNLSGCGTGPKIARLMMLWNPENGMGLEFQHIIPIDSRWLNSLKKAGVNPSLLNVSTEKKYRQVEDDLVEASYELNIFPFEADGIIFGWILN